MSQASFNHPRIARFDALTGKVTQFLAMAGVLGVLAIAILSTLDVVVFRFLLNSPIPGSNEVFSTVFAIAIAALLPSGFAQRGMLDVDLIHGLAGTRKVEWLRVITGALFAVALGVIAWRVMDYAIAARTRGLQTTILEWKLWPFMLAVSVIFALCVPVQVVAITRAATNLMMSRDGDSSRALRNVLLFWIVILAIGALVAYGLLQGSATMRSQGFLLGLVLFGLLWLMVLGLFPVALALFACGFIGISLLMGLPIALTITGTETMALITSNDLAILPMFLLMGGLASASGMAGDIYRLATATFGIRRGGLALATIGGSAGFGALTGSSLATVATIGRVALPQMEARGYSKSLATGCIAAGGGLGQIIPPSTAVVIYAILVEESIGRLYIAMLVPAAISILMYMATTAMIVSMRPDDAPGRVPFDRREVLAALRASSSTFLLFGSVVGGIFFGIFTATEAAGVGVLITFVVAVMRGKVRLGSLRELTVETTQATAMLYLVLMGAGVFSFFMSAAGLPDMMTQALVQTGYPALVIILLLVLVYVALGCVMDAFTILLITAPMVSGVILSLGYDLVWWGVIMVVVIEIGVITPPFGMNLFVMKSVAGDVPLPTIYRGVMPYVATDIVKVVLLILLPSLTLWLPTLAFTH